jgi:hypothetical protein
VLKIINFIFKKIHFFFSKKLFEIDFFTLLNFLLNFLLIFIPLLFFDINNTYIRIYIFQYNRNKLFINFYSIVILKINQ